MKLVSKILIGLSAIGLVAGGLALAYSLNKQKKAQINQSVLYIGIPKIQDDLPVRLQVSVKSSSGSITKTYDADDLAPLEGQDENLVFLNYTADPLIPLEDKEIGYWLNDSTNSIRVRTECLELIRSDYINIDKAGIWFVNVASQDGLTPDFSHSYVYNSGGVL